jgi:hypothetical protein
MSRKLDTLETLANTGGGFFISYGVTLWVFPLVGIETNPATAGAAVGIMFFVSTVRSFATRRVFRWIEGISG